MPLQRRSRQELFTRVRVDCKVLDGVTEPASGPKQTALAFVVRLGGMWFPLTCLGAVAFLSFDLCRAFDDNDVLGRPWPGRRETNPSLWWTAQVFRVVVLMGFLGLGISWALSQL